MDWNSAADWGGTLPAAGNALIFTSANASSGATLSNSFAVGTSFAGITFNSGSVAYTMNGNSINLSAGITNSSSNLQTFSETNGITNSASSTFTVTAAGGISITTGLIDSSNAAQTTTVSGTGGTLTLGSFTLNSGATATTATFNGSGNVTITGAINNGGAGVNNLAYSGTGKLTLNGASNTNFTGTTTVSNGAIVLGNQYALQNNIVTISVANGLQFAPSIGAFTVGGITGASNEALVDTSSNAVALTIGNNNSTDNNNNMLYTGILSGTGSLTKIGTGLQVLTGTNTYSGTTTISAGTLQLGNNGTTGSLLASGTIVDNGTLTFSRTNAIVQGTDFSSAAITGTGGVSLTVAPTGSLTLNAANTYSGTTLVSAGTLITAGTNSSAGATTMSAGTLQLDNASNGGLASGLLTLSGGTLQNLISGTQSLSNAVSMTNVFTVSGTNGITFVGGVTNGANNEILTNNIASGAALTISTAPLNIDAVTGTPLVLTFSGTGTTDISSVIQDYSGGVGTSHGALTYSGTGLLDLSGVNTYSGLTTVNSGTVQIDLTGTSTTGTANRMGASYIDLGGGTFSMLGTNVSGQTSSQTINGINMTHAGASNVTVIDGAPGLSATLTIGPAQNAPNALNSLYRAGAVGSTLNFNLPTTGSIIVSGYNNTNILGGWVTVNNTDWAVSSDYFYNGALNTTSVVSALANYVVSTSGTTAAGFVPNVDFQASNTTPWATQAVNTLRFNTTAANTLTIGSGQTLTDYSGGILETANVGSNNTLITGGTITIGQGIAYTSTGDAGPADLVVFQNNTSGSLTIASTIVDYGTPIVYPNDYSIASTALTKSGLGVLAVTGANTYTGGTFLNAGALAIGSSSVVTNGVITSGPLGTGTLNIAAGATVDDNGSAVTVANPVILNTTASNGAITFGAVGSTGSVTFDGTSLYAPATFNIGNAATVTVNNTTTIKDAITGSKGITLNGTGTLVLTNNQNALGVITINSGSLQIGGEYALSSPASVTLNSNNGLTFSPGVGTFVIEGLLGAGNETLSDTAGGAITLVADWNNQTTTYSGALSGNGSLTKEGTGTLTLTGASTYTGTTAVDLGTLNIGGSTSTGSITGSSLALAGGTLTFTTTPTPVTNPTPTQTFTGTTVNSGYSNVNAVSTDTIALGAISHNTGGMVNFTTASAGPITTTSSNVSGIVGPWATVNSGTSVAYATVNGSNQIVPYTAATADAGNLASVTSSTANYKYSAAATVAANSTLTGNTLQYTGAATITALGNSTLTLNGLMNSGSGVLTISNTSGNGLIIGSTGELDITSGGQGFVIFSVISGTGNLVYGGPGAGGLTLSGANTFTGTLTDNVGGLTLQNNLALGGSTGLVINQSAGTLSLLVNGTGNSGTITFTGSGGTPLPVAFNNSTTVTVNNNGSNTGNQVVLGPTTLGSANNNMTLTVAGGNTYSLGIGAVTLTGNVTLLPTTAALTTGAIGGVGNLILNGSGTSQTNNIGGITSTGTVTVNPTGSGDIWVVNGASTYSGLTTITTGTLQAGAANVFSPNSDIYFNNGGALNLNNYSNTVGSLSGVTGTVALGTATLTIGNDNTNQTYTGVISGSTTSGLTKTGVGTQILTGLSTYTGVTTINGGILNVTTLANGGTASNIGQSSNLASNLILNGGTLQQTSDANNNTDLTDRLFTLGTNGTTTGGTIDMSQTGSTQGVWFTNTGNIAFSAANTQGATLTLTGTRYVGMHPGNLAGNYDFYDLFDPSLGDNGSLATSLVKNGPGLWVVGGANNLYSGGTTVNAGVLQFQTPGSFGTGPITVASGATVVLNVFGTNSAGSAEFTDTNLGSFIANDTANFQPGSTLGLDPSDVTNSNGTTSATGSHTYIHPIDLTNGNPNSTVNLGFYNTTGNMGNVNALTMQGNITLGAGGISIDDIYYSPTYAPFDYVELQGTNSYTGATTLNGGWLVLGSNGALGNTSAIVVAANSSLGVDTGAGGVSNPYIVTAPIQVSSPANTSMITLYLGYFNPTKVANSANFTFNGSLTGSNPVTGAAVFQISGDNSAGTTTFAGPMYISNGGVDSGTESLDFGINGGITYLNGNISDTASGTLVGVTGNLSLGASQSSIYVNGQNTYTGITSINRGTVYLQTFNNSPGVGVTQLASSSFGVPSSVANGTIQFGVAGADLLIDTGTGETTNRNFVLVGGAGNGGEIENDGTGALIMTGNVTSATTGAGVFGLQGSNTGANSFQGTIADGSFPTSFTKAGAGTWALANTANTFTGATTITGGMLQVAKLSNGGVASSIGASSNLPTNLIISNGTLQYTGTGDSTDRQMQIGTTSNNVTSTLDASGTGAVNFTNTGALTYGTTALTRTLILTGTNAGANTLAAAIGNNGTAAVAVTKSGTGNWVLSGANTYTGATTINDGTLQAGAAGAISAGSAVTINDLTAGHTATLDLNGNSETVASLTFGGTGSTSTNTTQVINSSSTPATLKLTAAAAVTYSASGNPLGSTISVNNLDLNGIAETFSVAHSTNVTSGGDLTVSSVIQDGALTKTGTGILVLSGANTFTGATTISTGGGIINYQNGTAFGTNSAITDVAGTTVQVQGGIVGGSQLLTIAGTGATTAGALGTGALESVSGTNSYAGAIALGATGTVISSDLGSTFNLTSAGAIYGTATGYGLVLTGAGNGSVASVFNGGTSTTAGAGTLTKTGAGTWTLSGANTYSGATAIQNGALSVSSLNKVTGGSASSSLGAPTTSANGTIALGSTTTTGALIYTGAGETTDRVINLAGTTGGGTIENDGTGAITFSSNFSTPGAGVKTFTLQGSNTGANTISGTIGNNSATNTTSVTKAGAGTWVLTGANTFSGVTSINAGTLSVNSINSTATAAQPLGEATSLSLASAGNAATLNYSSNTATTLSKSVTVASGGTGTISNTGTGLLTVSGTLTKANSVLMFSGGKFNVTGQITGGTTGDFNSDLDVNGASVTIANATDNYTGPTYVYGGGTLQDGTGDTIPTGTVLTLGNATDAAAATNTFDLNGNNQSVAALNSTSNSGNNNSNVVTNTKASSTATLTLTGSNSDGTAVGSTFGGVIQNGAGTTALTIAGGTHNLSGVNTYTGATTVNGGTLIVSGSTAAGSAVAINNGGTLGGAGAAVEGRLNGAVTVAAGGNINLVDNTIGTLSVGGLTTNGATLTFEIGTSLGSIDKIADAGTLTIGSGTTTITIDNLNNVISGGQSLAAGSYTLLTYTGSLPSNLANLSLSSNTLDGKSLSLSTSTLGSIILTVGSPAANGQYTLTTTVASLNVHAGGESTTLTTSITNTGTTPQDMLNFSSMGATGTGVSGSTTSGGPLADSGGSATNAGQTFTSGSTAGNVAVTPTATVTNNSDTGETPMGTTSGATINVYSGKSIWAGTGTGGSWGYLSGTGTSVFGTNWGTNQGSPGVDSGFTGVDTATFNNVSGQGTQLVTLDGASPNLNSITFNAPSTSYTIAQGTPATGMITMSGITPSINVSANGGSHTISAPVSLAVTTTTSVAAGQQLAFSGPVSGAGGLNNTGAGTTVLSARNTYSGGTTVNSGVVFANAAYTTPGAVSSTGTGGVTVNSGATLAGSGTIAPTNTNASINGGVGVKVNSGATLFSGGVQTANGGAVTGTGMTLDNSAGLSSILTVNGGNLAFALGTNTTGSGSYNFNTPSTNSTFMTVTGNTAGEINFVAGSTDSITIMDVTPGATLALRQTTPYVLIEAGLNSDYANLVTAQGTGPNTTYSIDGNGWVVGVWNGLGDSTSSANLAANVNPILINQVDLTGQQLSNVYPAPALYLNAGDLEVVPEPGTWALMLGGLALLIFIQRRRNKLS